MKMTFRWYGEGNDSVPLKYIRQIPNCSGIMGVLDQYAAGEVWPLEVIQDYVKHVNSFGLEVEVIESVNVHEDIKLGLPTRDKYIENYIQTIKNLAQCGIKVIVYNFMPVFDWLRTDLNREIEEDGSTSLYYDQKELEGMTPQMLVQKTAETSGGFTLPGWEPERLAELDRVLKLYESVDEEKLLENYKYFLEAIIPTCEEVGVRMAVHPDDPAWPVFGIPRIAHSKEQFDRIVKLVDSPANALCLCTGSLGSSPDNDIPAAIRHFGEMDRIACTHVRNVKYLGEKRFREASHLSADGDLDMFEIMRAIYETCPDVYIRPDHGRMIWDEQARAGYGLYDRALGIAYLNGIWEALEKTDKKNK
ncbi:MAG: mannonate dehydratase [Clostridiales bacterium]|nr:mannonate dehydratase [Clostridiales bacterium]